MPSYDEFEDLPVWQAARTASTRVFEASHVGRFARDYGLQDQINRAAVSVMANVAEGFERAGNREFIQFLYIAKGSAGEVRSHLYAALARNLLTPETFEALREEYRAISKQLSAFIAYLVKSTPAKTKRRAGR